jgi:hypothetical protein
VHLLILWLWLGLDVEGRASMLSCLIERAVEAYLPPATVLRMAEWIEACLRDRA